MYSVVSFDIFDTLVHRRVRAPVDVFEAVRLSVLRDRLALLNHDRLASFPHQRMRAEREAREILSASEGGEGEVRFDEIYDRYEAISGCNKEFRNLLQMTELRLEKTLLFASHAGLEKYKQLRGQAHRAMFISDMYLPSDWLLSVLEDLGFPDARSVPIFVSGEYRKSKSSGALYQLIRDKYAMSKDDRWLHVGDNPFADITNARAQGLETIHADWAAVDNRRVSPGHAQNEYLIRSIIDFLEQPQARPFVPEEEYASIGYRRFGPIIFGFVVWIMAKTRELGLEKLAFIARDGWLPFELFRVLKQEIGLEAIEEEYVYFSRQAGFLTGVKGWDVDRVWPLGGRVKRKINESLASVGLTGETVPHLIERQGLQAEEIITDEKYGAARALLVNSFEPILKICSDQREKFGPYFNGVFEPGAKTGLVDIGWHGNIQKYLIESLDPRFRKEQFTGLFLGLHPPAAAIRDRGYKMHGWVVDRGQPSHVHDYLVSGGVELLEFALTSDHGTTLGFKVNEDGSVAPVLEDLQPEEAVYRERAMKVQAGIRKFVEDYRFMLREFDAASICSTAWSLPFERLVVDPTPREIELLADLSHSDTAGTTSSRVALAERQSWKVRALPGSRNRARKMAYWKVAFDRLNS
jgi:predicted HAD superfamily hydrolase